MFKALAFTALALGLVVLLISGGYWRLNIPPRLPHGVSGNAVFLWARHLGLPAPKHGTWIECWFEHASSVNKCKLNEMDGTPGYQGIFLPDKGKTPVSQENLKIETEPTSDSTHWVRLPIWHGQRIPQPEP